MKQIVLLVIFSVSIGLQAQTTHTVTNTNDSGLGSLRNVASNAAAGDTIRFSATLISSGSDTLILTTGEIAFGNKGITIKGLYNTSDTLYISGNHSSRIFSFNGAGSIFLDSLFLVNGNGIGAVPSGNGGAVCCYNCNDTLYISNSTISGNSVSNDGGGVFSYSSISSSINVFNSTISGNSASSDGGGVFSSAPSFYSYSSTVKITNSTISGNSTTGIGGGIYSSAYPTSPVSSSVVSVEVTNSTISGNSASNIGGGIYTFASSSIHSFSKVNITNSTISENTDLGSGGGIYSLASSPTSISLITVISSIIAENGNNSSGIYNSHIPTITSDGYNIFSDVPMGAIGSDSINITTAQLNLQSLAYNGGATQTMRPGAGSVAIDHGNPNDNSNAQNASIVGTRDVGAAEGCFEVSSSIDVITCTTYPLPSGRLTCTQSGVYKDTLLTSCGTDSILTINLTIVTQFLTIDTIVACNGYTWIDGITYTSSNNSAADTLVSSMGCDSVIILDLTIVQPSAGTEVVSACGSYMWNGITYTSNNNIAQDTLVNMVGCDSIVTLDLTILNSTSFIDVIASCSTITWLDGITYNQTIYGPIYTIPNSLGCDSVITLDFTILEVDTSVTRNYLTLTAQATNATYQWIDCDNGIIAGETNTNYTATTNGSYQVEVTQNGCVDTSACFAITNVGIGDVNLSNNINIYPNPVYDQVNIEITNWLSNGVEIVVRDVSGKQIYSQEVESISNKETVNINTSKWAKGAYFIEVGQDENHVVKKIVVQ